MNKKVLKENTVEQNIQILLEQGAKVIPRYENYIATKEGKIFSIKSNRYLKPETTKQGYLRVRIRVNGKWPHKRVHRLIAITFIPNPNNLPQVNHISGDKKDNRVENLEWCSASDNLIHRYYELGKGTKWVSMIDKETGEYLGTFRSFMEIERKFGYKQSNIWLCCQGKIKSAYGYIWRYALNLTKPPKTNELEGGK